MDITITLSAAELSAEDQALLQESLNKSPGDLPAALTRLCKTAFMEYLKMLKEKGIPTRADDVLQERLFLLLNHYFINRVPNEDEISPIFQLTESQSKTLLRNFKTKYRTKISSIVRTTLHNAIGAAEHDINNDNYYFVGTAITIIEELNKVLKIHAPKLKPIEKEVAFANKYLCEPDTYNYLTQKFV